MVCIICGKLETINMFTSVWTLKCSFECFVLLSSLLSEFKIDFLSMIHGLVNPCHTQVLNFITKLVASY